MFTTSYMRDVSYAAKSKPSFDKANAEVIADLHGDDPAFVLRDIKFLRNASN